MDQNQIVEFERLTYSQKYEEAARALIRLIREIDGSYGMFLSLGVNAGLTEDTDPEEGVADLTRMAAAIAALFSNPNFEVSDTGYTSWVTLNRWISAIFYATPFRNTDHVLRVIADEKGSFTGQALLKLTILYSPESIVDLPIDLLYKQEPRLAISLALALISSRYMITQVAHQKRETLLSWLPDKLSSLSSLDDLPISILHDAMMHCSYADLPGKHEIKIAVNRLIRRDLTKKGFRDIDATAKPKDKPVMLVFLDWWHTSHAMYRCYARMLMACRSQFRMVAVGLAHKIIDEKAVECFDELYNVDHDVPPFPNQLRNVLDFVEKVHPDVVYYPAVGMSVTGIFLSNLRLAPLQIATLGHPATVGSDFIDYVLTSPEFAGDPSVFHERVALMPKGTFCFLPHRNAPRSPIDARETSGPLRIAVAGSFMKLNPRFLDACKRIRVATKTLVQFHFLSGATGIAFLNVRRAIQTIIPDAVVYPDRPYSDYLTSLSSCQMFLCPFPFGNTNGIIDCVRLGLPGVCLYGDQPHSAIDKGMFEIAGLPGDLIASNVDQYVSAASKLADDAKRRKALRRMLVAINWDLRLTSGTPEGFCNTVWALLGG